MSRLTFETEALGTAKAARASGLAARSLANLVTTLRILRRRLRTRPAIKPGIDWIGWVVLAASLTVYIALTLDVVAVRAPAQAPRWMWNMAQWTSDIGASGWYLAPAALFLLVANLTDWSSLTRRKLWLLYNRTQLAFFVLVAVGLPGLFITLLKHVVGRARPEHFSELGAFSFNHHFMGTAFASFPSGHGTTVGSLAAILIVLCPRTRHLVIPLAIWLAGTRILTSSHYLSDIVAGCAIGFLGALLVAVLFARLGFLFRLDAAGRLARKRNFRIW
jgi:membrane-associated phospholipid phosphatase